MFRVIFFFLLMLAVAAPPLAQETSDAFSKTMAAGDLYMSKRKYELALEAYQKADKLARHTSAACYLKLAFVKRKLGDFSGALDDAKRALKLAGEDKQTAIQAHLFCASILSQMAGKPTDKKLRQAEEELRQVIALDATLPLAHFNLGVVLLRQGRDPEGIAELNLFLVAPGADPAMAANARRMIANPVRAREPFAPDFSFRTHDNQSVSSVALRGKVVLLDFWATWCPPCRDSVPVLRDLHKKYKGKPFQLIGVSADDDEDLWRTFIETQHMEWPDYIDASGDVLKAFQVESFPTFIVVDKDGVIRYRQSGFGDFMQLEIEDAINSALKRPSNPALAAAATPAETDPSSEEKAEKSEAPESASATPLLDIEDAKLSDNTYKNEALGITFEFPRGWIAAKPQSLHEANEQAEAKMRANILQQHPEMADRMVVASPKIVFYASRRGEGNGERMAIPCIRIRAVPTSLGELSLNAFTQLAQNMATASGMRMLAPPAEFTVKEHSFLRVDFEQRKGGARVYYAFVQTLAGDYLLGIEITASSLNELQQITASLQSMIISDE